MKEKDLFKSLGIEVDILDEQNFLKIKETLTRIGIASKKEKKLYQSVHILHKQGRYAIMSFKELFVLDGKENTIEEDDISRRNTIVNLLEEWNLLKIITPSFNEMEMFPINKIKILSFKEKNEWELCQKYNIGVKI